MPDPGKTESQPSNVGFLSDTTDGREKGQWETRYPQNEAQAAIRFERNYLIIVLVGCLLLPVGICLLTDYYGLLQNGRYANFQRYVFGWLGGVMGGTIFSMKWLYHSVARSMWNIDRRLWRIFTPHLSGVLALITTILINCGMWTSEGSSSLSIHKTYAIGFLVGYFSDNAVGKLTEIAQVFFGSNTPKK